MLGASTPYLRGVQKRLHGRAQLARALEREIGRQQGVPSSAALATLGLAGNVAEFHLRERALGILLPAHNMYMAEAAAVRVSEKSAALIATHTAASRLTRTWRVAQSDKELSPAMRPDQAAKLQDIIEERPLKEAMHTRK